MDKETLIINLFGAPGAGKSTMAAGLFYHLKLAGVDCELVTEFAKDLVWEQRNETFKDQLYLLGKQNHKLFRANKKVDVIITDSPILLQIFYGTRYVGISESFIDLVIETHHSYNNINFLVKRVKEYNPNGRNEDESTSDQYALEIADMLNQLGVKYEEIYGNKESLDNDLLNPILEILEENYD